MKYAVKFRYRDSDGGKLRILTPATGASLLEIGEEDQSDIVALPISSMLELRQVLQDYLKIDNPRARVRFRKTIMLYDCLLTLQYESRSTPFRQGITLSTEAGRIEALVDDEGIAGILAAISELCGR